VSVNPPKTTSCSTCLAVSLKTHVEQKNNKCGKPGKHHHKFKTAKPNNDGKNTYRDKQQLHVIE
jgi:hypothetical protein